MNESNSRIPEEIADDVLRVASELYAKTQNSYSVSDLQAAGQEVSIPPELIDQAIEQVKEQRRLEEQKKLQAKQTQKTLALVGGGIAVLAALWGILAYNSLNSSAQRIDAAWAEIENQLQRRAELLPQLVNVTKAQAKQEKEIVTILTNAQNRYNQARTPNEKLAASESVDAAILDFNRYASQTSLGSSKSFIGLQYEIAGTANRIKKARSDYIEASQNYNQKVRSFPTSIVARLTGFQSKEYFKAENTANPDINLNN